jgi:hypothetical protein
MTNRMGNDDVTILKINHPVKNFFEIFAPFQRRGIFKL